MAERLIVDQKVAGSKPVGHPLTSNQCTVFSEQSKPRMILLTTAYCLPIAGTCARSSMDRASDFESAGCEFKSRRAHLCYF